VSGLVLCQLALAFKVTRRRDAEGKLETKTPNSAVAANSLPRKCVPCIQTVNKVLIKYCNGSLINRGGELRLTRILPEKTDKLAGAPSCYST
jgi:hypothetical protein